MLVVAAPAGASWGGGLPHCSAGEGHHCYALTEAAINNWADIGTQDTHFANVNCASGGFVSNEMWISFGSAEARWIEVGQTTGYVGGFGCDPTIPHLFYAKEPGHGLYKAEESTAGLPVNSYNYFALSDIPEKNGNWNIYYSSPPGYTGWIKWGVTTGWPAKATVEQSGMEAATETQPTYEGSSEVAYTNTSIIPSEGWKNWTGASEFRQPGTCILPLPVGEGRAPGNSKFSACGAP